MTKLKLIFLHSLPFALGIVLSYWFWRQPNVLLVIYLVLTTAFIRFGRDRKTEFLIAIYGIVAGFVVEALGTQVSGYQSFSLPQILGIPYWLIISWAFGFILMKRIGLILTTGTSWVKQ